MFLLRNEPKIVDYLRSMSSQFCLYIGTDILVQCMSECLLSTEDQRTKNTLKMLKDAGSTLVLTDSTIGEVWHHLRATHYAYVNNYYEIDQYMKLDIVEEIKEILIRSYFNSKLKIKPDIISWNNYISSFCTYSRDELCEYLINDLNLDFESSETTEMGIDIEKLQSLSNKIYEVKGI